MNLLMSADLDASSRNYSVTLGCMAGWLEIAYKISCPAHPASQQPDCLAGQICRQPASQPAATPTTPPTSRWRPCATPPRGRLVGLGEPRMGWAEPPGHPGPGQLALTGRGGRGGAVCSHIFKCHNTVYQYLVLVWDSGETTSHGPAPGPSRFCCGRGVGTGAAAAVARSRTPAAGRILVVCSIGALLG